MAAGSEHAVPDVGQMLDRAVRLLTAPAGARWRSVARTLVAFGGTVGVFAVLIQLLGASPGAAMKAMITGSFGNQLNLGNTIMIASLLALTGLAAAIPFSAHLWNVGGEGQMWFGAFVTVAIALTLPSSLPHWVFAPIVVVLAMLGGATWGLVPGVLKAWINANEVITSLMMTFIAIEFANWAIDGLWPQGASNQTAYVPGNSTLPNIWPGTFVTAGAPLAVAAVVVAWVIMARTKLGFEIRAIGLNANTARMSGMRFGKVAIVTFGLAGAFAGLAGAIYVLGIFNALSAGYSTSNFGYLGIAVALVARLNPAWIIPSALLFAFLRVGSNGLQAETALSPTIGEILVATFVVLLLAFRVIRLRYAEAAQ
jgi:general nucleoside transport system permease protein